MARCQAGLSSARDGLWPAAGLAAGYVVSGDTAKCTQAVALCRTKAATREPGIPDAHGFIVDQTGVVAEMAVTLDWCWPELSTTDRDWLMERMTTYANWYAATNTTDVFHDDMNNIWSAVAIAGLAMAGTSRDADARRLLMLANNQWKNVIFPAIAYAGDWWHEGFTYVQPTVGSLAWTLAAWTSATDEDLYAYARDHGDLVEGYLRMHAYALRPDDKYVYFGDTADPKQTVELFSRWLIDMLTYGSRSPLGQGLSMHVRERSRPYYDYSGAQGWLMALLYDAGREATATRLADLPPTRWLGRGSQDIAVVRSGWDRDSTYVWVSCGDYLSAHQHLEVGAFQMFRKSMLTGSTGTYDNFDSRHWWNYYAQKSVHANTLAIVRPDEFFPSLFTVLNGRSESVNDGGQRNLRMVEEGRYRLVLDLPTYLTRLTSGPFYETGGLQHVVHSDCHDYIACDATAAYSSPGRVTDGNQPKVDEVSRQFVFLRPSTLVVFDRVSSTDAAYEKRFLLHALGAPTTGPGGTFSWTVGEGRLAGRTVLPREQDTTVLRDFTVVGVARTPTRIETESGGTRIEVSPRTEAIRDYFLHVITLTDAASTNTPEATVMSEDARSVVVDVRHIGGAATLRFAKTGPVGGHIFAAGGASCDRDFVAAGGVPSADAGTADGGFTEGGVPDAEATSPDAPVSRDATTSRFDARAPDADTERSRHLQGGCSVLRVRRAHTVPWLLVLVGLAVLGCSCFRRRLRDTEILCNCRRTSEES